MSYLPGNVYWAQLAEYFGCIKDTCWLNIISACNKIYEAKFNSFYMCKLLIKTNIVQTWLWDKPIYKRLYFRKQLVFPRLFIRNLWHGEMNCFNMLD